jgi:acyl carrier protein
MSEIGQKVHNFIVSQLAVAGASISPATTLESLCPDPYRMADFIVSVEEAFGIDIPDDEFDGLLTVGDLIAYVKRRS